MTKRVLVSAILQVLGDVVDGLTEENLKIGVWSGKISLNELRLNRNALMKLNLPYNISSGFIGKLEISIPWTALESQPVRVLIDDVYVSLQAVDLHSVDFDEAMRRNHSLKEQVLQRVEKDMLERVYSKENRTVSKNLSYFQRLAAKVIDNLEVRIRNVHLRLENTSTPANSFSCGLTLQDFTICATNDSWEESYIDRSSSYSTDTVVHKLATVRNLALYWNNKHSPIHTHNFDQWLKEMRGVVLNSGNSWEEMRYVMESPNFLCVKLLHDESRDANPKLKVKIESTDIKLRVDKTQYHQLCAELSHLRSLEFLLSLRHHRPVDTPKSNPKAWWVYAAIAATGNEYITRKKADIAHACCYHRARYMELLKIKMLATINIERSTLSSEEEKEIYDIEQLLPIDALIVFRQLVTMDMLVYQRSQVDATQSESATTGSSYFWNWFGVGSGELPNSKLKEESDMGSTSLAQLQLDLENAIMSSSVNSFSNPEVFTFDIDLATSASLNISSEYTPVMAMHTALSVSVSVRAGSTSALLEMTDILVVDKFTRNPVISNLVCIQRGNVIRESPLLAGCSAPFALRYDGTESGSKIVVTVLPLEVCLNALCIRQLLAMLHVPEQDESYLHISTRNGSVTKSSNLSGDDVESPVLRNVGEKIHGSKLDFKFEADAPKIIVPEHSSTDNGYLLLDTGHLSITGYIDSGEVKLNALLSSVNAGLPIFTSEMYSFSEQSLYLIRPFSIDVQLESVGQSGTVICISLAPSLCGELDVAKLSRVMHVIDVVSLTFRRNDSPVLSSSDHLANASLQKLDPLHRSLVVNARIPSVSLTLQYSAESGHTGLLRVKNLHSSFIFRCYDFQATYDMGELSIEDSLRPAEHQFLASTPSLGNTPLVHISYIRINGQKSPLFRSVASEVEVEFAKLHFKLDPSSVLCLRPFYEVILGKRLKNYPVECRTGGSFHLNDYSIADSEHSRHIDVGRNDKGKPRVLPLTGMHCVVHLESISLELLRQNFPDCGDETATLYSFFSSYVEGLCADVNVGVDGEVKIKSFTIVDTRKSSENSCFKTVLCPMSNPSDSKCYVDGTPSPLHSFPSFRECVDEDQFIVNFDQRGEIINVDLVVRNVTGFVSLDTVMDLVNTTLLNTFAVLDLVRPIQSPGFSANDMRDDNCDDSNQRGSVLNVRLRVPNPKLLLLEDPSKLSTKAIVGQCDIDLRYCRKLTKSTTTEIVDTLHITTSNTEVFVLMNMRTWVPHQILYPMTSEFHMNRSMENGIVTMLTISFDGDTIAARVSLNDILLAKSIMMRRTVYALANVSRSGDSDEESEVMYLTAYNINISVGESSLVIVNDFNGKNLPICRLLIDGTTLHVDGVLQDLRGSGSLILQAESFNTSVSEWEPIIDRWHPQVVLTFEPSCIHFNALSNHTLQISVTTTLVETVLQVHSILLVNDDQNHRDAVPAVTLKNHLGIPIRLQDSVSKIEICRIESDRNCFVSAVHHSPKKILVDMLSETHIVDVPLPDAVDLHFVGKMSEERLPLMRLSLKSTRPQRRLLRCFPQISQLAQSDPIIEEVFENERYNPLNGCWVSPFILGDPPAWCNASLMELKRDDVKLPSDSWEWCGPWKVDTESFDCSDSSGWFYALNFSYFDSSDIQRHWKLGYCVRRRRWTRVRRRQLSAPDSPGYPLTLVWECRALADGSKVVVIRSFLQFENCLPFEIDVLLHNSSWGDDMKFGPIAAGSTFSAPIFYANAISVKFRPSFGKYTWSESVCCSLQLQSCTSQHDILCSTDSSHHPLPIRTLFKQLDSSIVLTLYPFLTLSNELPCDVQIRCSNCLDLQSVSKTVTCIEEVNISAGAVYKLRNISSNNNVVISVNMWPYGWSQPAAIEMNCTSRRRSVYFTKSDASVVLHLYISLDVSAHQSTWVRIYSEYVLLDRTKLELSVSSEVRSNHIVRRETYNRKSDMTSYQKASSSSCIKRSSEVVDILNMCTRSKYCYVTSFANVGSAVYEEKSSRISFLPSFLCGCAMISTASRDKCLFESGKTLLSFETNIDSYIFILYDSNVNQYPPWLAEFGFSLTDQIVILSSNNGTSSTRFRVFGKLVKANELVSLGYNYYQEICEMYLVLCLPYSLSSSKLEFLAHLCWGSGKKENFGDSWCHGRFGLTLFSSPSGSVSIGVKRGTVWTKQDIDLNILGTAKGPFEVIDKKSKKSYQLAYSVRSMPGAFSKTKILTVVPRYCIINNTKEFIEIRQKGAIDTTFVEPFGYEGWHKSDYTKGTEVQLKSRSSKWSLGSFDINEMGNTDILLPRIPTATESTISPLFFCVEVRLAEPFDNCAVVVVISDAHPRGSSPLSIKNDSSFPISIRQAGVIKNVEEYEYTVPSNTWLPYGWADPELPKSVIVGVGDTISKCKRTSTVDLTRFDNKLRIPNNSILAGKSNEVVLSFDYIGSSRVINFSDVGAADDCVPNVDTSSLQSVSISFTFSSTGISFIADSPVRREVLSVYVENMTGKYSRHGLQTSIDFKIADIQVDNYFETAVYPVLLRRVRKDKRTSLTKCDDNPVLQFACTKEVEQGLVPTVIYRYVALRVLELAIEVDSGSIQLFISDFLRLTRFVSRDDVLALNMPHLWIEQYNQNILKEQSMAHFVDVNHAVVETKKLKAFFQNIVLHPIKIAVSYLQSSCPRREREESVYNSLLNLLTSIASVELMEVKLNSFIASNVLESNHTLLSRVQAKMWQDLQSQLAQIAGSLTILGSPVGLARNIGSGLQDFFYEPYLGLVQSPEDFIIGFRKGTSSLMAGVVSGTLTSTAALINSASSGLSYLSGDADFVRIRSMQRQRVQASRYGALTSLKDGSEQLLAGFTSGIGGLFTKPIEEAHREGTLGFLKGVGLGVVGVAVKPVLGVADGFTSIAHGISNEVADSLRVSCVRPPRTFHRSEADPEVMVLSQLNIYAARAQAFVSKQAANANIHDAFIAEMKANSDQQVILSERYVYIRQRNHHSKCFSWTELSHISVVENACAMHVYGAEIPVLIQCRTIERTIKLYTLFEKNSHRVGNPAFMIPVDMLRQQLLNPSSDKSSPHLLLPELGVYKFGTVNNCTKYTTCNLNDEELLAQAKHMLENIGTDNNSALFEQLDNAMWWLLSQWNMCHELNSPCKIVITLLLNYSSSSIQLSRVHIKEGRKHWLLGSTLFDSETNSILPNGFLVLFACSHSKMFFEHQGVEISVMTSACELNLAVELEKSSCTSSNGFTVGFLEKSSTLSWGKYVLVVS